MTPAQIADPMQQAVEVLARALRGGPEKGVYSFQSQTDDVKDNWRTKARALLAEIAPMIVADSDRRRADHAKLYASRGTE